MGIREFTFEELVHLDDGRLAETVDQAVERISKDLHDRPGCLDARKLTIELAFVPVVDEGGAVDTVKHRYQVKDAYPTRKSRMLLLGVRGRHLSFQSLAPDNPDQLTLDQEAPEAFDHD